MDDRPIGVFDSGLGGLTGLNRLMKLLPYEDFIYFGDTARLPYGTRSAETIIKYSVQDCRFLVSKNVKAILSACGTASSNALGVLKREFSIPITGIIDSAARKAAQLALGSNGIIAVLATTAAINSGAFQLALKNIDPGLRIIAKSCPMFVPLVENGYISQNNAVPNLIAGEYLSEITKNPPAAVILGCTHYPLLSGVIKNFLPDTPLISAGDEAAEALAAELKEKNLLNCPRTGRKTVFYISDEPELFGQKARIYFGERPNGEIHGIDIGEY